LYAAIPTASLALYTKIQTITTANVANEFDYLSGRTDNYYIEDGSMPLMIERQETAAGRMRLFLDCDSIDSSETMSMFLRNEVRTQSTTLMLRNTTSNTNLKLTLEG
jgi:hypothetical protein